MTAAVCPLAFGGADRALRGARLTGVVSRAFPAQTGSQN